MSYIIFLTALFFTSLSFGNSDVVLSIKEMKLMTASEHQDYLTHLRELLGTTGESRLVIAKLKNGFCESKGQVTCQPGLYGENRCIRYPMNAHSHCLKRKVEDKDLYLQFVRPTSIRFFWNELEERTRDFCKNSQNKLPCNQWQRLADKTRDKYAFK